MRISKRALTGVVQAVGLIVWMALSLSAGSSSIAGKWTGSIEIRDTSSGTDISTPISIRFDEPQGSVVSGKISSNDEEVAIKNGKVEGNQLTFEASGEQTSGPMKFILKVAGDQMEGQMKGAIDTQDVSGKVSLTRQR